MTCERCGSPLTGMQRRWCSARCQIVASSARRRASIDARGRAGSTGRHGAAMAITDAKVAAVKARYPSCARDWDLAMVEKAWPRLAPLLTRRMERLG